MTQPIFEQDFWKERLSKAIARGQVHRAVFETNGGAWQAIEDKHVEILKRHVKSDTSILDAGCGWGRLLTMLPEGWEGRYLGIDLSHMFIDVARSSFIGKHFVCRDLREPIPRAYVARDGSTIDTSQFDLCILVSMRPMVIRNAGGEVWDLMEKNIRERCDRILYLEYDPSVEGELVVVKE